MTTWQKVCTWTKSYWYLPLLAIAAILVFVLTGGKDWALKLLQSARQSYADQVAVIEALNKEKEERARQIQEKYDLAIAALEAKYAADNRALEVAEKKRVKELVTKYKDDPAGLTQELANAFGFQVI